MPSWSLPAKSLVLWVKMYPTEPNRIKFLCRLPPQAGLSPQPFRGVFSEPCGYRHDCRLRRIPVRVEAFLHGRAILGEVQLGTQRYQPQVSGFPILDVRAACPMLPSQTPRPRSPTHDPLREVCEARRENAQGAESAKRSSMFPVKVLSDPERRFFWISSCAWTERRPTSASVAPYSRKA